MKFKLVFLLVIFVQVCWGQSDSVEDELVNQKIDTVLINQYKGSKTYFVKKNDSINPKKHGRYSFESFINNDQFKIDRLQIEGEFEEGKKNNNWEFKEQKIQLKVNDISIDLDEKSASITKDLQLSGQQTLLNLNYKNGVPDKRWTTHVQTINNTEVNNLKIGEVNFHNGVPSGEFMLVNGDGFLNKVQGTFNKHGFLDGELVIEYKDYDGKEVTERRTYYDGFLLHVKLFEAGVIKDSVTFQNTVSKIEQIKSSEHVDFEFSTKGFGILFDTGTKTKKKLDIQKKGNEIIINGVNQYNKFHQIGAENADSLQFNFTRRFKINYSEKSEKDFKKLTDVDHKVFDTIVDFVNDPSVILNKDKSKELTTKYFQTKAFLSKLTIIDNIVQLQKEKYFDYVYRNQYLENVLDTINNEQIFSYSFQNEKDSVKVDLSFALDKPKATRLEKLFLIQDSLTKSSLLNIKSTYAQFKQYAQKEKIDSLNLEILQLNLKRDSIYHINEGISAVSFKERKLSTNIFLAFKENIVSNLFTNYINTENFDDKLNLGKELIKTNEYIIRNKSKLARFDDFIQQTDSLFTIYRDNPFDYRKSEVKIYPNINRKSKEVLFPYYVNNLLETTKYSEFVRFLNKLEALDEKLLFFVRKNDDDVQRVDRAVRRENVPQRIERIYGLQ